MITGTAKDDDSSSDEDGELVRQRFDRMSSRQQGSDKVKGMFLPQYVTTRISF